MNFGPSIIYNAFDVDMTKYNSKNAFRYKRYIINEDEYCGLNDNEKRKQMQEEIERLNQNHDDNFKYQSYYTRTKRQAINNAERNRTCCYIYVRIDPTLWDIVYKNEGLNVMFLLFFIFINVLINISM